MQYAMLIYLSPADFDDRTNEDNEAFWGGWRSYFSGMVDAGVYAGGNPLEAITTGATVRVKDGKRRIHDGPYAETKEQLGGFVILEAPSLEAAIDWAARCPAAATGAVEVRPVRNIDMKVLGIDEKAGQRTA
ncbi:MAG: YciI family protein [Longimicrobiales bacterium]